MSHEVLIVSSSYDKPTWGPVAEHIEAAGLKPFLFETDKIATGETPL